MTFPDDGGYQRVELVYNARDLNYRITNYNQNGWTVTQIVTTDAGFYLLLTKDLTENPHV